MIMQNSKREYKVAAGLILISLLSCSAISAQDPGGSHDNKIISNLRELIGKYQKYGQFTTDGVRLDEAYITEFYTLFDKNIFNGIYNDLNIEKGNSFSSPEEYVSYIRSFYPQGIDLSLETGSISLVDSLTKKGLCRMVVKARKHLTGLYGGKEIHNYDGDIYFFVKVPSSGLKDLSMYKITGIHQEDRFLRYMADRKSKGLYLGLTGGFSLTRIYFAPAFSGKIWSSSPGSSFSPTLDITFMITNGIGAGIGFRSSVYETGYSIKEYNQTSEATVKDIDGDNYNPVLKISDLQEVNTIRCNEIPLLVKTRIGTGNTKAYINFGVVYSIISKSYFTLEGSSVVKGYYPQYDVTLQNIPEYGFGTYNYSRSLRNDMTLTSKLIFVTSEFGASYNIGRSFVIKAGARINYGLTDIGFNKIRHPNDFNNILKDPVINAFLQSAAIEIGLSYKIL